MGTNLSPFERSEISDFVSCLCDKFTTLLTNFPFSLLSFNLALLSSISCATSESLLLSSDSTTLTKSFKLLISSLSLISNSRHKCLFATRFLTEVKGTLRTVRMLKIFSKPSMLQLQNLAKSNLNLKCGECSKNSSISNFLYMELWESEKVC